MTNKTEVIQLRVSKSDAKALDRFVSEKNRRDPRNKATRASVLREGLWRMLGEHTEARS
jgi:hypothetical protein